MGRGKGDAGSGGVCLFFFIIWFGQEMRAFNDWKQLWAVTSGAGMEQEFLQMQPLRRPSLAIAHSPLNLLASSASPPPPLSPAPPSEEQWPWVSKSSLQETNFTWESFKKKRT